MKPTILLLNKMNKQSNCILWMLFLLLSSLARGQAGQVGLSPSEDSRYYQPLEQVSVYFPADHGLKVFDADGNMYHHSGTSGDTEFTVGGALGRHRWELYAPDGKLDGTGIFDVDCHTDIRDAAGTYSEYLDILYWSMVKNWGESGIERINGKFYKHFVRWLRDHVHTMKGMKYFYGDLQSGIGLYADTQREDGMIWDNVYRRTPPYNHWQYRFSYGDFIRVLEDGYYEMKRIPVENDVEYLFLEGIYYTWKATGDDAWMRSMLDPAREAVHYSLTDPYRWSRKYGLLKRGFTIDTWDFQSSIDVARTGDPMVVRLDTTKFGIMFGDNTGMARSLEYLAEMLEHAGFSEEAYNYQLEATKLRERLNTLSWQGEFYKHHVPEDPSFKRDLGVDPDSQVTLSNAYSINRNIGHVKAKAIIQTYMRIREEMPESSPGEWYTCYPPFERGFGDHNQKWDYMNGGVTTIVAGELAHGAFEHGFEDYGVDILNRTLELSRKTQDYLHCTYKGAIEPEPLRSFTPLPLDKVANADLKGTGAEGVPGWTGEGINDLRNFPTGSQTFGDIPFEIADPALNGRRAVLAISGAEGYKNTERLPVNKKAASVYVLHAIGHGSVAGKLVLEYQDGERFIDVIHGSKISNWWYPSAPSGRGDLNTIVAWRGENAITKNVGAVIYGLNNPHPEKEIRSIYFEGMNNPTRWMVLGITLSDTPVYFRPGIVSFGIPDNWGAAALVYALVEGLAGVKNEGTCFDKVKVSPRWSAAGTNKADVSIKYPARGGYVSYHYEMQENKLLMNITGNFNECTLECLLEDDQVPEQVKVNDKEVPVKLRSIEDSRYILIPVKDGGTQFIEAHF